MNHAEWEQRRIDIAREKQVARIKNQLDVIEDSMRKGYDHCVINNPLTNEARQNLAQRGFKIETDPGMRFVSWS